MAGQLGIKGWVGFKKEVVPGTAETGTNVFLPAESFNLTNKHDVIKRKALTGVIGMLAGLAGKMAPSGKADTELVAGSPHPFYWALGTCVTSTITTGVYQHTITVDTDGALVSLTAEGSEVVDQHRQAGVLIDSLELGCAAGEVAGLKIGWLGKSHDDTVTLSSVPSYKTDVLTFVGATVTLGTSGLTDVGAAELKIDNALEQVWALTANNRYPAEVRRKGQPKLTGKLTFIDYPAAEYARLQAADQFKLTLYFEGAVIGATAYKRSLTVVLYACQYQGGFEPDIKADVVTTDGEFEAFYSPTDTKIISIVAVNDVAALIP